MNQSLKIWIWQKKKGVGFAKRYFTTKVINLYETDNGQKEAKLKKKKLSFQKKR